MEGKNRGADKRTFLYYNEIANLPEPVFDSAEDFDVAEDILKWFTEQVAADADVMGWAPG